MMRFNLFLITVTVSLRQKETEFSAYENRCRINRLVNEARDKRDHYMFYM